MDKEQLNKLCYYSQSIPEEETAKSPYNPEGDLYVVVNLANNCYGNHPVMPADDIAHTYHSVEDAAWQVYTLMEEYDHTIESARVYKLVPVPLAEVSEVVIQEWKTEWEDE